MDFILFYFVLFIMYSFLGWCMEMVVCYFCTKKWVNRGFLLGPICPIYGCGCLIILLLLNRYLDDCIVLFVMAVLLCSLLEYFTSYLMEKLFKARWWDYSDKKYHINGRICLENAILFGVLGLLLSYIIHPAFLKLFSFIPTLVFNIVGIILLVAFIIDLSISLKVISSFTNVAKTIRKDSTEEITRRVREILNKRGYIYRRLVSAFDFKASEKLIVNIKNQIIYNTYKAGRMLKEHITIKPLTKEGILKEYREKVNELKEKIKIEKEIRNEKLKKLK